MKYTTKNTEDMTVSPLYFTLEETAHRLGVSIRTLHELRKKHLLYAPDGSKAVSDSPKKDSPLWSDDLIRLIAFARSKTPQGVRQFTDDEALKIYKSKRDQMRRDYLAYIEK